MNNILRSSFGIRHLDVIPLNRPSHFMSIKDLRIANNVIRGLVSIAGHDVRPTDELRSEFPDIEYYSFFRDPLTRTASHYQYQVQRMGVEEPFEAWIERREYRNFQVQKLVGREDIDEALSVLEKDIGFVGLTHRFDESLMLLKQRFDYLEIRTAYRSKNVAKSNAIKDRILNDPELCRIIADANRLDKILFEHATERFAEQVLSYRGNLAADVAACKLQGPNMADRLRYGFNVLVRNAYYKPIVSTMRMLRGSSE